MEEYKGLRVSEPLPSIVRVETVVSQVANFARYFPDNSILGHTVLGFEHLPRGMDSIEFDVWIGDRLDGQCWPAGPIKIRIRPCEDVLGGAPVSHAS